MTAPVPVAADFARWLVTNGTAVSGTSAADVVNSTCTALADELNDVLGAGGVAAIAGRALHLARRQHPVLSGVTIGGGDSCYSDIVKTLSATDPESAAEAGISLIAHYIGLLILLMGEDLGMQPVRKLWPAQTDNTMETGNEPVE